ncbi:MAG: PAS domain S-box protein [Pseudomonadota bacterium]
MHPEHLPSIRTKLLLLIVAILIPVLLVEAVIYYQRFERRRIEEIHANIEVARLVSGTFGGFIKDILHQEFIHGLSFVRLHPTREQMSQILRENLIEHPALSYIHWISNKGFIAASTDPKSVDGDRTDRSYFREILAGRSWFLSGLYTSRVTGKAVFSVARGIRDQKGALLGVMVAVIDPEHLSSVIALTRTAGGAILIIDKNGRGVCRFPKVSWTWDKRYLLEKYPMVRDALKGKEIAAIKLRGLDNQIYVTAFSPIPSTGWVVAASRTEREIHDPIIYRLVQHGFMFLLVFAGSLAGAWALSRTISEPIGRLRDQVRAFSRGETVECTNVKGSAEICELASTFEMMARRIVSREEFLDWLRRENELILNSAGEGIFGLDSNGKCTFINPAGAKMLGYEVGELISEDFHSVLHRTKGDGSDYSQRECAICGAYKDGAVHRVLEDVFWRKDGQSFPAEYTSTPVIENGRITGAVVTFQDITERKQTQEALKESERRYQELYDSAPDMYLTMTPDGLIRSVNQFGADYLGYSKEDLVGEGCWMIIHQGDAGRVRKHISEILDRQTSKSELEFRALQKNGRELWIYARTRLILDEQNKPVEIHVICRDETDRKKLEESLFRAHRLEAIGLLAGGIAHDFNNLLTSILGNINLAKFNFQREEAAIENLNKAEAAISKATSVATKLLTFAKGGWPITSIVSVSDLLKAAARGHGMRPDIRLELLIPEDIWPVDVDENQMVQTLNNLIGNANEAMPHGGTVKAGAENLTINAGSHLPLKQGRYVRIYVEDSGAGIPEECLDKVFDAYFTTKEDAQGLGLAIAHSIIKKHEGHIEVKSQLGIGTTVYLYLPAAVGACRT